LISSPGESVILDEETQQYGEPVAKSDLIIGIRPWDALSEPRKRGGRRPKEWYDLEEKSEAVARAIENRLLELGYNPQLGPGIDKGMTVIEHCDIPRLYFCELRREIDAILKPSIENAKYIKNKYMGFNMIVSLGKDIGADARK
jgi:hypothetical protein